MSYFKAYSEIRYKFGDDFDKVCTDILQRVSLRNEIVNLTTIYDDYFINAGESPDIVAYKLYGRPEYHWIIMLTNNIVDPFGEWPMSQLALSKHVIKKYGVGNEDDIHHWEQVYDLQGEQFKQSKFVPLTNDPASKADVYANQAELDSGAYERIVVNIDDRIFDYMTANEVDYDTAKTAVISGISGTESIVSITNRRYEELLNIQRQSIKIIKPKYVSRIVDEFNKVMRESNI